MAIGTSLGAYYDTDLHHQAGVENNVIDPDTTPDLGTRDQNVQTPKNTTKTQSSTASTMPVGGSTEPAGAFKSETGTTLPADPSIAKSDYDYDSWQKANPGVEMLPGQHYPDTYKLPNHMTFSDESMYHGGDNRGGHWGTDEQGKDTFTPGPTNLEHHSMGELRDYFKRVEPDAKLLPPDISDVPHHDWVESLFSHAKEAFKLPGEVFGGKVDPTSVQGIEKAADLAGLMVTGPAPVAAKMADGTLGSFMGVRSKTFDRAALNEAQEMKAKALHSDDIWVKTHTFEGAEGRWRQEIPDDKATLRDSAFDKTITPGKPDTSGGGWTGTGGTEDLETVSLKRRSIPSLSDMLLGKYDSMVKPLDLERTLDHPELFKAYPELRGIKVEPFPYKTSNYGMYSPGNRTMYLADNLHPEMAKSVLLHETQHAIQDIEGFARGGSKQEFMSPEFVKQDKMLNQEIDKHLDKIGLSSEAKESILDRINTTPEELKNELSKVIQKTDNPSYIKLNKILDAKIAVNKVHEQAFEQYQRLMGEVESRNVQARMNMENFRRQYTPPQMTEDRPRFSQINADNVRSGYSASERSIIPFRQRTANDNMKDFPVYGGISDVEQLARKFAESDNGKGSWDRIGGGGQEHYWRDAERALKKPRPKDWDK